MKKKLKLKSWVKKTLLAIGVIGAFAMLTTISNNHYRNAVESCVAGGNTRTFCENTLR